MTPTPFSKKWESQLFPMQHLEQNEAPESNSCPEQRHSQEPGEPAQKHRSTTNKNLLQIKCVGFFSALFIFRVYNKTMSSGVHNPRRRKIWRGHSLQLLLWALQKLNLPGGWIFPGMRVWPGSGTWEHINCSPGSETKKITLVKETIKTEKLKAKRENSQGPECSIP